MKKKPSWPEDPVVSEVRRIRQQMWKEAGGTIEGLTRLLDREVPATPAKSRKPRPTKSKARRGNTRKQASRRKNPA